MSATFKNAKKKYTQNELRRLMNEHKSKVKQPLTQEKINSPLAKYNDLGQLTCILCKSIVRSESVWKVHINSKQHKENIEAAKLLKQQLESSTNIFKRPADPTSAHSAVSQKKLKLSSGAESLLEEAKPQLVPSDFFDSNHGRHFFQVTLGKTSIKKDLVNIKREVGAKKSENKSSDMEVDETKDELLPEGFFDDPVKDAKVRNQEYKDPQDEEWERFQREIKEESTVSNAIIAEEQEEATTERQIEEIDEQIRKWSKVLDLERRKEDVSKVYRTKSSSRMKTNDDESDSNEDSDDNVDEFFDWRAKRCDRRV